MKSATQKRLSGLCSLAPPLFILMAFLYTDGIAMFFMLLSAVLWHECGHVFAFLRFKTGTPKFSGRYMGFSLTAQGALTKKQEICATIAGPLANILAALFALFCIILFGYREVFAVFLVMQVLVALINLFPALGTDGGRLLHILLERFLSKKKAFRFMDILTTVLWSGMFFIAAYFFMQGSASYSAIFFPLYIILTARFAKEQEENHRITEESRV